MADRIERWLPVTRYGDGRYQDLYAVSNDGAVRSFHPPRTAGGHGSGKNGGLLRPVIKGTGRYLTVTLCADGRQETVPVHVLVLTEFDRPSRPGEEARHGPGGRLDNRWPENLCWGTPVENWADRWRDDTVPRPAAKLTADIVLTCRKRITAGERQADLAREYGVSPSRMSEAVRGITWPEI